MRRSLLNGFGRSGARRAELGSAGLRFARARGLDGHQGLWVVREVVDAAELGDDDRLDARRDTSSRMTSRLQGAQAGDGTRQVSPVDPAAAAGGPSAGRAPS